MAESSHPPVVERETISLRKFYAALRAEDLKLSEERDRRYAEVNAEKEKALIIKDTANRDALALARQDQTYKDEQANKLKEQINSERGLYATKADLSNAMRELSATIKPLSEFVSASAGSHESRADQRLNVNTVLQMLSVIVAAAILYAAFHH